MAGGQLGFLILSHAPNTLLTYNDCMLKASNFKNVNINKL